MHKGKEEDEAMKASPLGLKRQKNVAGQGLPAGGVANEEALDEQEFREEARVGSFDEEASRGLLRSTRMS